MCCVAYECLLYVLHNLFAICCPFLMHITVQSSFKQFHRIIWTNSMSQEKLMRQHEWSPNILLAPSLFLCFFFFPFFTSIMYYLLIIPQVITFSATQSRIPSFHIHISSASPFFHFSFFFSAHLTQYPIFSLIFNTLRACFKPFFV